MADTSEQQRIRTISTINAGQFLKVIPGKTLGNHVVPALKIDLLNETQNFSKQVDLSDIEGINAANEFNPTATWAARGTGRISAVITTEQRLLGGKLLTTDISQLPNELGQTGREKAIEQAKKEAGRLGWGLSKDGTPFLKDAFGRPRNPFEAIILHINPSDVAIQQSLRAVESKNKSGTVLYTWRDHKRKTFFDEPVVTFTFHSGNILPFTYLEQIGRQKQLTQEDYQIQPIPRGLANFYRFLEVLDDVKILPDGRPNFVYITHNSRKFPRLTLVGFFNSEGVTINDTVDDPHQVTWQATFTCRFTFPQLSDSLQLIQTYQEEKLAGPPAASPDEA